MNAIQLAFQRITACCDTMEDFAPTTAQLTSIDELGEGAWGRDVKRLAKIVLAMHEANKMPMSEEGIMDE